MIKFGDEAGGFSVFQVLSIYEAVTSEVFYSLLP